MNQSSQGAEVYTQQTPPQSSTPAQSPYVGFWVRFAAIFVDSIIGGILTIIILSPLFFVIGLNQSEADIGFLILVQFLPVLISFGYFIYFTHAYQATLGKKLVGIKVLSAEGYKLSLGKVIMRETVGRLVCGFSANIGYIITAFTGKKQGLHDMIAGSVVTYADPAKGANTKVVIIILVLSLMLPVAMLIIISSIASSSLGDARDRAKTASFKAAVSSAVPSAIIECDQGSAGSLTNIRVPEGVVIETITDCTDDGTFEFDVMPQDTVYAGIVCSKARVTPEGAAFDC